MHRRRAQFTIQSLMIAVVIMAGLLALANSYGVRTPSLTLKLMTLNGSI